MTKKADEVVETKAETTIEKANRILAEGGGKIADLPHNSEYFALMNQYRAEQAAEKK